MEKGCCSEDEMSEILKLCSPVMKYMDKHYDPYTKVVIDMDGVKVLGTELSIPRDGRPEL
ncbi:MAG: hypothetical protein PHV18_05190 [Lachnospiraceae bacterium]|nr:hypothetical protein [Lachnospiraceae bacterium]